MFLNTLQDAINKGHQARLRNPKGNFTLIGTFLYKTFSYAYIIDMSSEKGEYRRQDRPNFANESFSVAIDYPQNWEDTNKVFVTIREAHVNGEVILKL